MNISPKAENEQNEVKEVVGLFCSNSWAKTEAWILPVLNFSSQRKCTNEVTLKNTGTAFHVFSLPSECRSTGTHLQLPFHRYEFRRVDGNGLRTQEAPFFLILTRALITELDCCLCPLVSQIKSELGD